MQHWLLPKRSSTATQYDSAALQGDATSQAMKQWVGERVAECCDPAAWDEGSAPAAVWRLCSDEVAQAMSSYLANRQVDEDLLNADLCLIPKPGKPPDKPSNLRPLGILGLDGKGLAGATRTALAPCISGSLMQLPQFAYLPGRGLSAGW